MWSSLRQRRGLRPRIERHDELVPWAVEKAHRWAYPLQMLRAETRRRSGLDDAPGMEVRLDRWLEMLARDGVVVAYDPTSEDGFSYAPRTAGDTDLIRLPEVEDDRAPIC